MSPRLDSNILHFFDQFLSILFPKDKRVGKVENLSATDFENQASSISIRSISNLNLPFAVYPLFSYKHTLVKSAIWEVKYNKNRKIAELLAKIITNNLPYLLEDEVLWNDFKNPIIVPIPSHKNKIKRKGFNQAEFLLESLECNSKSFSTDVQILKALEKITETGEQRKKTKTERLSSLCGTFRVIEEYRNTVKMRNIIVFDDVITTGGTLIEAHRTLKDKGARKVIGLTIAH